MKIGFLLFHGLEELDLVGPWELFKLWSRLNSNAHECLMIAQKPEPIRCAQGMAILPHTTFAESPQLDILLVPGGEGTRDESQAGDQATFIAHQAPQCKIVCSVCTGSFLLHRAGLLNGKRATTHWSHLAQFRTLENIEVVEERVVHDGNIWTSAGVSAGMDLALHLIAELDGEKAAGKVQLGSEYYPEHKFYAGLHQHPQAPQYLKTAAY